MQRGSDTHEHPPPTNTHPNSRVSSRDLLKFIYIYTGWLPSFARVPYLPPSLRLPGFTRDICIVIAQDNSIPVIFSKLDAEIVSPKTPPHGWVGMTGCKMNRFSQQFMTFPELLKCGPLKLPPGGLGVEFCLLIFWALHDISQTFELFTP